MQRHKATRQASGLSCRGWCVDSDQRRARHLGDVDGVPRGDGALERPQRAGQPRVGCGGPVRRQPGGGGGSKSVNTNDNDSESESDRKDKDTRTQQHQQETAGKETSITSALLGCGTAAVERRLRPFWCNSRVGGECGIEELGGPEPGGR